jgi:small-conductance mechanosensitive channel
MKRHHLEILVPSIFATTVLALAVSVGAQTSTHAGHPPAAQSPEAAPMAVPDDSMMAKCQAMMAKKKEMRDELAARDAALDELVAKMNAAATSQDADAVVKPMAAVLNELVAQRKANRPRMMEMQPEMMAHMMRHMEMHGTKGAMECPMMKMEMAHESETEE